MKIRYAKNRRQNIPSPNEKQWGEISKSGAKWENTGRNGQMRGEIGKLKDDNLFLFMAQYYTVL